MKHSRFLLKFNLLFLTIFSVIVLAGCTSVPDELPADTTAREIIQKAQNASNTGNDKAAEYYYNILLQRYGMDTAIYIEGTFEIAHLCVKQKRYSEAATKLQEILDIYNDSTPGMYPAQFRKLAQIDLAKIPSSYLN